MNFQQQKAKKNKTIQEHADDLIAQEKILQKCGYVTEKHIIKMLEIACRYHDDGKANPEFQKRVNSDKWIKFNETKELPHNVLSTVLLPEDIFENKDDYYSVATVILHHHDFGNALEILEDKEHFALAERLLLGRTIKKFKGRDCNNLRKYLFGAAEGEEEQMRVKQTLLLKGLLHKCDYSASGGYQAEYPNDFLVGAMENVKKKWPPQSDWNDLQKFAMHHRDENIIMIAQTGMGKTEAGLQWIGNNKGFFVLPIRTAINAVYERVKTGVLENNHLEKRLALLHSSSLEYYTENIEDAQLDTLVYEERGKNLSMPLNISTMDQLFDFVFKYPGYEFKLATFSYSRIVVDEIQMYDPNLLAYLLYGLNEITNMGGHVAIMTATLAPFLQDLLMEYVAFKTENIKSFSNDLLRHNAKIIEKKLEAKEVKQLYERNQKSVEKKQGNKILVVCNTIKKAQAIYEALREEVPKEQLHLLHSRFTRNDRAKKEAAILDFGKTYNAEGALSMDEGIWISTSLVEASLDIDFDYLVTELQDINSLFQRFGRCNRKGAKTVEQPNCYVYTEIDQKLLSSSKRGFIDVDIYNLSKKALKSVDGLITEKEKMTLIGKYMTSENLKTSQYMKKCKETLNYLKNLPPNEFKKNEVKLRQIDTREIIPHIVYEANYDEIKEAESVVIDAQASSSERIEAKNRIQGYAVSVYNYEWAIYQSAIRENKAEKYSPISLGGKVTLDIMECHYDEEMGYRSMNYTEEIRDALIF